MVRVRVLWHSTPGISFPLPRICGNGFVGFCLWPNNISCLLLEIFFIFPFHWIFCLPLYCPLSPVLVVVGGPSLPGPSSQKFLSNIFQKNLPVLLPWLMPLHFSWCWILNALVHSLGASLELVCWILALWKNILRLCFVPPVLICRMHLIICG